MRPVGKPDVYAHAEYRAFVASMRDAPDDDVIRLACADWLQEHGKEEHAEFIRVQCELARLPDLADLPGGVTVPLALLPKYLRDREPARSILNKHGALLERAGRLGSARGLALPPVRCILWQVPAFPPGAELPDGAPCFAVWRGFVHTVRCSPADWFAHADEVLARHPVTAVELMTRPYYSSVTDHREHSGLLVTEGPSCRLRTPRAEWLGALARFDSGPALTMLALLWPGIAFTVPPPE